MLFTPLPYSNTFALGTRDHGQDAYVTLSGREVALGDGHVATQGSAWTVQTRVKILGEELCYNDAYDSFKLLTVSGPLEGGVDTCAAACACVAVMEVGWWVVVCVAFCLPSLAPHPFLTFPSRIQQRRCGADRRPVIPRVCCLARRRLAQRKLSPCDQGVSPERARHCSSESSRCVLKHHRSHATNALAQADIDVFNSTLMIVRRFESSAVQRVVAVCDQAKASVLMT